VHTEERRRMWFDHYISIGQYSAAQRIAEAEKVPTHAPPPMRVQGGAVHESVRLSGLHLPSLEPFDAACAIQKSVRGEQARAAVQWLREERKHRVWLQYCIETNQMDAAAGLGIYHELAVMLIQRAFRRMLVASNGYELGCPNCNTAFVLRKVPEGRVAHKCPNCKTRFEVEVAQQAWWKSPRLLEDEDPAVLRQREREATYPFKPADMEKFEESRREWIKFYLSSGDLERAKRLGFQHDVMALRIQRAWRAYQNGALVAQEATRIAQEAARIEREISEAAEKAKRKENSIARRAAVVLQRATRRKRLWLQHKRARLVELAARMFKRKADELVARFLRLLTERGYDRAKRQYEASRIITRTFRRMEAGRARETRRKVAHIRSLRAARLIQRWYMRHKLGDLEKFAHGYLGKRSHKGKWQSRYFYVHRHTLCYLPGSAVPQPKATTAVRKALVKWEQTGEQPGKVIKLGDIRNIVGDRQNFELELTLANGQKRSYKATSEHELLLWKRTFEKYSRVSAIAGL